MAARSTLRSPAEGGGNPNLIQTWKEKRCRYKYLHGTRQHPAMVKDGQQKPCSLPSRSNNTSRPGGFTAPADVASAARPATAQAHENTLWGKACKMPTLYGRHCVSAACCADAYVVRHTVSEAESHNSLRPAFSPECSDSRQSLQCSRQADTSSQRCRSSLYARCRGMKRSCQPYSACGCTTARNGQLAASASGCEIALLS